jgi:tetratricopeptide (TPR) repeat protein/Tol biopolymer transport system component/predicted Ser/Thr protein kinase
MEKKSTYGLTPEQLGRLLSVASKEADPVDSVSEDKSGKAKTPGPAGRSPQIKGYEILGKLGEAGQGQIWRALQVSTSREVALKVPRAGLISSEKALARFEREVEVAAALKHPNIAQIHDSGIHQGIYYYAMDLIEGMPLDEYVKKNDLSQRQILELMQIICQAVQHAHQNGVIHRDLKPSNIVVTEDGQPYIVDFGLAKNLLEDDSALTVSTDGEVAGTPAYMSPEQAAGHTDKLDTRTDVYSLGVLLFALLTGEYPHNLSGSRLEVMRRIAEEQVRRPRKVCPRIDNELELLLLKALNNDPDRRYSTAGEMASDIDNYLRGAPLTAGPESGIYHIKKFMRRHRTFVAAAAMIVLTTFAGFVVSTAMYFRAQRALEALTNLESDVEADRILSTVQRLYAEGRYQAALTEMETNIRDDMLTAKGRLLHAHLLSEVGRLSDAVSELEEWTAESPETAGAAHYLLAAMYAGSDPEKAKEHQGQAESLLPETAEAYCLRATTAGTPEETLQWLAMAIQLDPAHYSARIARALTYYGLRYYQKMAQDVEAMVAIRPRDCLGYALRAIVRREMGLLDEAINDHNHAIGICDVDTELAELYDQRRKTHYQMGNYEQALSDAHHCVRLRPDQIVYRFHVFAALVALGHYEQAKAEYTMIVEFNPEAETRFNRWAAKHVFNTSGAGQPLNFPDRGAGGHAFRAMHEAADFYRRLDTKADRLITDGISPSWSPDGKKLAYGRSDEFLREALFGQVAGSGLSKFRDIEILNVTSRGIEILDLDSDSKRLLVSSGKDPLWSPDGESIAFTRWPKLHAWIEEEVWITPAGGGQEDFIANGRAVAWTGDSKNLYLTHFRNPILGSCLYKVSVGEPDVEPEQLTSFPSTEWAISPGDRYMAYVDHGELRIIELSSGLLVASWKAPMGQSRMNISWSPDGHEVSIAGQYASYLGLWIYELDTQKALKILDGPVTKACWSPGNRIALELGPPYFEIWIADLEQGIPTSEALGPTRSIENHYEDLVNHYTHSIEVGALGMDNYPKLAKLVGDLTRRGIEQYQRGDYKQALVTFSRIEELRRKLNEETHPTVIAFTAMAFHKLGQNQEAQDACDRFCHLIDGRAGLATEFIFATPTNLGPPFNSPYYEGTQWISSDGLESFFHSTRPPSRGQDLWAATRSTTESQWGDAFHLGPIINSPVNEWGPSISADGLELFFCSPREGGLVGSSGYDIWTTQRATRGDDWGEPVNLGPTINSTFGEASPCISADSLLLFFASDRPNGYGGADIWVTTRTSKDNSWGEPVNLGSTVNSPAFEMFPSISSDGLTLFFTSGFLGYPARTGGFGGPDLWVTTRATKDNQWGEPVNLGPLVNTPAEECCPYISPDSSTLYFSSDRPGGLGNFDLWQVSLVPIVDTNGNGQVDLDDFCTLAQRTSNDE